MGSSSEELLAFLILRFCFTFGITCFDTEVFYSFSPPRGFIVVQVIGNHFLITLDRTDSHVVQHHGRHRRLQIINKMISRNLISTLGNLTRVGVVLVSVHGYSTSIRGPKRFPICCLPTTVRRTCSRRSMQFGVPGVSQLALQHMSCRLFRRNYDGIR